MLYQLYELQRTLLSPMSQWAALTATIYSNPYSLFTYTPYAKPLAAGYELLHRLGKSYEKPEFGLKTTKVNGVDVNITEACVLRKSFCHLIHFDKDLSAFSTTPIFPKVLIVAPLSGHFATLLRDTVRAMLPEHDVYITDWQDAKLVPLSEGAFHLDDYVHYVREFITMLGPDVHVISVCQPTVPTLGAISLMSSDQDAHAPRSMIMMGGPIDARNSPTAVNALASKKTYKWFETNVIYTVPAKYPGYMRRVYPGFLQHSGFVAMNPDRHMQSHWEFYQHLIKGDGSSAETHRKFYDEYNAVLDLPAEYYLETIKTVFQNFDLPNGRWFVAGKRVAPEDIRETALLTIEGELDDISGSGQTAAAHVLCENIPESHKQHFTAPQCGHYGIFSGKRWREVIYPVVRDFIKRHEKVQQHDASPDSKIVKQSKKTNK